MRKIIVLILVCLIIFHAAFGALALGLDREKLLKLDPLPSKRLEKMAEDSKNGKFFPCFLMSALGIGIIAANADTTHSDTSLFSESDRDYHRYNQLYGGMFLLSGIVMYFMPTPQEIDVKVLKEMDLQPAEKEEVAYFKLKTMAEQTKAARTFIGLFYSLYGIGSMAYSSNFESESAKAATLGMGAIFTVMGMIFYFMPWPIENEVQQMDNQIQVTVPLPKI